MFFKKNMFFAKTIVQSHLNHERTIKSLMITKTGDVFTRIMDTYGAKGSVEYHTRLIRKMQQRIDALESENARLRGA